MHGKKRFDSKISEKGIQSDLKKPPPSDQTLSSTNIKKKVSKRKSNAVVNNRISSETSITSASPKLELLSPLEAITVPAKE